MSSLLVQFEEFQKCSERKTITLRKGKALVEIALKVLPEEKHNLREVRLFLRMLSEILGFKFETCDRCGAKRDSEF